VLIKWNFAKWDNPRIGTEKKGHHLPHFVDHYCNPLNGFYVVEVYVNCYFDSIFTHLDILTLIVRKLQKVAINLC